MRKAVPAFFLLMLSAAGWAQDATPASAPAAPTPAEQSDQQPVTTLKVTTRLVAVSAVVKNKNGESQTGLSKDDFILKQDGKEEPIRYFSKGSDLPLTIALMVDTSGSQRTFIGDESLASDLFLETMLQGREDRATLVQFDAKVLQLQGMTNSASALHLALLGLSPHASTTGGTLLQDAVYLVAKGVLAKETGRKAMVILTDGGDNGSSKSLAEAIEQAQRADVQIYSICYSAWEGFSGGPAGGRDTGLETLQKLSENTGGRVFKVSHSMSLRDIFAQIGDDLRLQYELGYTPPPETQPDSYHKLELKAKDKKLTVQARKGFFAPP